MVLVAALVLLIPLHLQDRGVGVISLVAGGAGVGGILSADLIGRTAERVNPGRLVQVGVATKAAAVLAVGMVDELVVLVALSAMTGVSTSAIRVGSQIIVRNVVANDRRGRVHGAQGFISRAQALAAPAVIGFLWQNAGSAWSFVTPVAVSVVALLVAGPTRSVSDGANGSQTVNGDSNDSNDRDTGTGDRYQPMPVADMIRYSTGPVLYTAARSGRMLLLPLVGLAADMSPAEIGLLVSLSAAADVLVAPVSGPIMDRRGRLATIVPAFSLMAAGFVVLGLAASGWMLAAAAIVLGLGNGFSSGLLLTLGTDLAPEGNEGTFLGRFGAMTDTGRLIGPFLVGLLGQQFGLAPAATTLALVTAVALGCVLVFIGETRPTPYPGAQAP